MKTWKISIQKENIIMDKQACETPSSLYFLSSSLQSTSHKYMQ